MVRLFRKRFATIRDVARASGTSVSTVSRVLNNKPDVSEETKRAVLEAVEQTGYVRTSAALNVRNKITKTVGVVFEAEFDPFFAEVLQGIEAAARDHRYANILMSTELDEEHERLAVKTLIGHRVDGFLFVPSRPELKTIRELEQRGFPLVVIGRDIASAGVDEVFTDDIKGGALAAEHLISVGRERLLFLNSFSASSAAKMRSEGFMAAARKASTVTKCDEKIVPDFSHDALREFVNEIFHDGIAYDGVFCFNDLLAFGVINSLRCMSISVPKDISVVGYDDISLSAVFSPSLTTVRIDKFQEGFQAFSLLMSRVQGKHREQKKVKLDVSLLIRESA